MKIGRRLYLPSGAEEDFYSAVLREHCECRFTAEVPIDQGRVLDEDRDPHSMPR
jgi:hypothetical protein